jgi:hypothetical protein
MDDVSFKDDSKKMRLLQVALRISDHFSKAAASLTGDDLERRDIHLDELTARFKLLDGDHEVSGFVEAFHSELKPREGTNLFDAIRSDLRQPYEYEQRLWELNTIALEEAKKCLATWGGPKAQRLAKTLKPLRICCESSDTQHTQLYFDRTAHTQIKLCPGKREMLLQDCMLLEFSFFHEYISHAFPNWQLDNSHLSEGWLLALEMDWFQNEYFFADAAVLGEVWHRRLGVENRQYQIGRWLLTRCDDRICVRRFLLEWLASWATIAIDENLNLLSLLIGAVEKAGFKLQRHGSGKQQKTVEVLSSLLCDPCPSSGWKYRRMSQLLQLELSKYDPPI